MRKARNRIHEMLHQPVSRRTVLKAGAAAGLGLTGLGTLYGQAPAQIRGTKLGILQAWGT